MKSQKNSRTILFRSLSIFPYRDVCLKRIISISMIVMFLLGISSSQIAFADGNNNTKHYLSENDIRAFTDELLQKQMENHHIAGAVLSVVRDGQVLFENGYGFYNQEKNKEVSPQTTLFRIGSITKIFTWTAVMQLVEKGEIDLDQDINFYLKDLEIPNTFDKPITMRNLMTHTAGFEDRLTNLFSPPDSKVVPLGIYLKATMPKRIYAPGEIIAYSNYGASLAGFIVEQVSGQKYADYIDENILKPLGMYNTFLEQPVPEAFRDNASLGFKYSYGLYNGYTDAPVQFVPAGAISSTADDMARFMVAHLQVGKFGDVSILNQNTAEEMHKRQFTSDERLPGICLGFMEWFRNGERIIWHSGGSQLFKSLFILIPEDNVGLFVSYNGPDTDAARTEFRQAFLDRYYPYEYQAPQPMEGYRERAKRYEGTYEEARTARHNSDKLLFALSRTKKATANKDGSITFRDTRYVEVEPLVFKETEGQGLLVFKENQNGEIIGAFQDFEPHEAYIRIPWYKSIEIQMLIFAFCLLAFLYAVLGWAVIRRMKQNNNWYIKDDNLLMFGRKLIRWISLLNLMFPVIAGLSVGLELLTGFSHLALGNIPLLMKISLLPPMIASILCCVALLYLLYAWKNQVWSLAYRLQYAWVLAVCLIFTCWLKYWNLIGFFI